MKLNYGPYYRSLADQLAFDAMIEHLKATRAIRPASTVQATSTQRTLERPKELDEEWINRPLPENWKADKYFVRSVTPEEIELHYSARPSNSFGASEVSATTPEKREHAISAIIYTPPAKVTAKEVERRAVNLIEYKSELIREEWKPLPWYKAIVHWARGNKIKVD